MSVLFGQLLVLGTVLGIGLWTCLTCLPQLAKPRLVDKLAPHVIDISENARQHHNRTSAEPLPFAGTLIQPLIARIQRLLVSVVGGETAIRMRLRQAGSWQPVEQFRMQQAAWAVGGAGMGLVIACLVVSRTPSAWNVLVLAPIAFGISGVGARELLLRTRAAKRMRRITSEFPTVLEFMTLALAAGESVFDAMKRIGDLEHSELAREFAAVIRSIQTGVPTATALRTFSNELGYLPLQRTCDHIITAMERGAPLAEVLQAQAADARVLEKRALLEQAGRNEIRMMFPLVLLILPVTVLFAIYPSFFVLTSTF
ncbi:type II secretion system F family protein [Gulosibacter bifidus]|uniref:Type II secretion system F family protein n=1 Tax=Gulosibacter bifidus TaxID=272239 RepID=A0ABW5RHK3_9MICO|nr:type II secretion system F family protein [Gulosibacter bifidus]